MGTQFAAPPFYPVASLKVDTNHVQASFFEDEDGSVLDDGILDQSTLDSGLELSPPLANSRRESFAVGAPLFPPKSEDWQSIEFSPVDMQSAPFNPFASQSSGAGNGSFMRLGHNHSHVLGPLGNGWLVGQGPESGSGSGSGSGPNTPFQTLDSVPTEYEGTSTGFPMSVQSQAPFRNPSNLFTSLEPGDQSIPTSPQREWAGLAPSAHSRVRPGSPLIRSHNDMRRGDGIRKKNARFEIPAERNLSNIDLLIAQSTDEQEIKELKQQKRLLRNRQAALDSRQRKKQHTERLEDEKKHYTALVSEMEEEMNAMREKVEQLARDKQSCVDYIETLTLEKDEMIRSHTIETGELRKRVGVLTEHVQRLEGSTLTSAVPQANHDLACIYDDVDDVTMDSLWGDDGFLGRYSIEPEAKHTLAMASAKNTGISDVNGDNGPPQGGLLLLLFLVGAFVMSSRSTPAIPRVSEDVRAASATLLDSVLKDAGVNSQEHCIQATAPHAAGLDWLNLNPDGPATGVDGEKMSLSSVDELGESLIRPTERQKNEQIFSISAAQYNGVGNSEFAANGPLGRSTSLGRKNLAEALEKMHAANKQTGAAEVYTRSLLWDQIPSEVVRNFAKMVAECNKAQEQDEGCQEET